MTSPMFPMLPMLPGLPFKGCLRLFEVTLRQRLATLKDVD